MKLNDYDALSERYKESDVKPDKRYSILPTVLKAIGDVRGKTALDLGCGSGFFSRAFIHHGASRVIGIDSSDTQIKEAQRLAGQHEEYLLGDAFHDELPKADVINAPFILNYLSGKDEIIAFLKNVKASLNEGGAVFFIIDLPSEKDLKKYGATKTVEGAMKDGAPMKICLYSSGGTSICELNAHYITPTTLESCLKEAGFSSIQKITPVVSEKGIEAFTKEYWDEYLQDTQLGYYLCS